MQELESTKNDSKIRTGRTTYDVEAGDSLASIALKKYSDARFARLIFTINRGEIPIRCDGFNTFTYVFPGQRILLPTLSETDVYRRNFLTESSRSKFELAHYARPAMPSDSIPAELIAARTPSGQWGEPRSEELITGANSATKYSITPAIPSASAIPQFQVVSDRERSVSQTLFPVRVLHALEECLKSDEIDMKPADMEPRIEIAKAEKVCNVTNLPVSDAHDKVDEEENLFTMAGTLEITTLSHYCRLMRFDSIDSPDNLIVRLQIFDNQKWQTISSYVIARDITARSSHQPDGSVDRVQIELPTEVAREISLNDYTKNWKNYTKMYFNQKEKIKLHQVTALHAYQPAV